MTYLYVNLAAIAIPLLASFHPAIRFDKKWFAVWPAIIITATGFLLWDSLYTHLGVWGFNPMHLMGVQLVNLPLEEWLFFICIPYACLFTYEALKQLIRKDVLAPYKGLITMVFVVGLLGLAAFNLERLYTSVTFIITGLYLIGHQYFWKKAYLARFWLAYFVLLIPFFLTNGVLTGSFIEEEVVWYQPNHFMGIRVGTIPFEDSIYGLLLILMNIHLFETFLSRKLNVKK